jgi:hypothetical protein
MGDSRCAHCLQGCGVHVSSGTVTITSSSIYGNAAGDVRARLQKFPSPRWDFHMFCALCLQGGGVFVGGGSVTISSSTIRGNTARIVRTHAQNFPWPRWEFLLTCPIDSHLSIGIDLWFYQAYVRASHTCKLPIAPMGTLLRCLPRLTFAQLRPTFRSTTAGSCCRRPKINIPIAPMGKCLADMLNSLLTCSIRLCSIGIQSCSTRDMYVPATPAKCPLPDGKVADVLASTHACTTANTSVNYS